MFFKLYYIQIDLLLPVLQYITQVMRERDIITLTSNCYSHKKYSTNLGYLCVHIQLPKLSTQFYLKTVCITSQRM